MARGSGQWGGEQHRDYLRRLEAERKDEPGCIEVAAHAVGVSRNALVGRLKRGRGTAVVNGYEVKKAGR